MMKKIYNSIFALGMIALVASCSPKYSASFQKISQDNGRYAKLEKMATDIDQRQDALTDIESKQAPELTASTNIALPAQLEVSAKALVENHRKNIEAIKAQDLSEKEIKKEIKKENKEVKKELMKELKAAKKAGGDDAVLMYILAVLIPPLAVGLVYDIGTEFWISLLLTLLFWIPGAIYAVIKISQKY